MQVSYEQGLSTQLVTGETIRATLLRFGIRWKRAKRWITSPDPEYARKKARARARWSWVADMRYGQSVFSMKLGGVGLADPICTSGVLPISLCG